MLTTPTTPVAEESITELYAAMDEVQEYPEAEGALHRLAVAQANANVSGETMY